MDVREIYQLKTIIVQSEDINAEKYYHKFLLNYVAEYGYTEIVTLLLNRGANINIKSKDGYTPLHYAAMYGHKDILEILLVNKANVNEENYSHQMPLHLAASQSNKEIVEILLKYGANINVQDFYKNTPLHWATIDRHKEIVKYLLDHGANWSLKNRDNEIPKDQALRKLSPAMIENFPDKYKEYQEIVEILISYEYPITKSARIIKS